MQNSTVGPARQYEIIDKATGLVYPVTRLGSGDMDNDGDADFIAHREDNNEEIVFAQPGYVNDLYVVRDRETKLSPDGVTPVEDIIVPAAEAEAEEKTDTE